MPLRAHAGLSMGLRIKYMSQVNRMVYGDQNGDMYGVVIGETVNVYLWYRPKDYQAPAREKLPYGWY